MSNMEKGHVTWLCMCKSVTVSSLFVLSKDSFIGLFKRFYMSIT